MAGRPFLDFTHPKKRNHPPTSMTMRPLLLTLVCAAAFGLGVSLTHAASATVGQAAPNFTLPGADGKSHSLARYAGKFVVLEWTNPNCPFVKKFYGSNTMQNLQKEETAKGVVWLRINSGAPGHDGYQTAADLASYVSENHVAATHSLIDADGKVGHTYGARNTPQMFVINPKGTLIYAGGIDNKPSADPADIATATNYVRAALDEAMAGQPVKTPTAPPYGCSVKYASN
jgi:peroxiredoxin